jgi:hypothetical protein
MFLTNCLMIIIILSFLNDIYRKIFWKHLLNKLTELNHTLVVANCNKTLRVAICLFIVLFFLFPIFYNALTLGGNVTFSF